MSEIRYYINSILQDVTPELPSPTEEIKINKTAPIGYPDPVDSTEQYYEFWTTVRTQQQITDSTNTYILEKYDVLTDENNEPFTDENGIYQYL